MSKYRDRLQIVADILSITSDRAGKTRIMYRANLSYRLLCRYLDEVLDAGLIRPEEDDRYVLTAKGLEFLGRHEKYAKRCKTLDQHFNDVKKEKLVLEKMCFGRSKSYDAISRPEKDGRAKARGV